MGKKNMLARIIGWALLTVLAIAVAIIRIVNHSPYFVSLIIAILMFILLLYFSILRRVDGTSFYDSLKDERLWQISGRAQRYSFWFLFISVWCLAATVEFFGQAFFRGHISLVLSAIGTIGLLIYMFGFVWHKYKV